MHDIRYEDWKDVKDLDLVCEAVLDNCDLNYTITHSPLKILLTFYVTGSNIKVIFECSKIVKFSIEQEWDDVPLHLVLDVKVRSPISYFIEDCESNSVVRDNLYCISVVPEAKIDIECLNFNWKILEFGKSERKKIYGSYNNSLHSPH